MKQEINIETVLRELYELSGCRVSIHDTEYTEIASYPEEASPLCRLIHNSPTGYLSCVRCDTEALSIVRKCEEPYVYRCPQGLYEAVAPLYHSGVLTGYLMIGQIADSGKGEKHSLFKNAMHYAADGHFSPEELRAAIDGMLTISAARFRSFVSIMNICAEYITLSGRMDLPVRDLAHMIKKYIHGHFAERISLDDLCEVFRCSKSTLMNSFRRAYSTSINKYLTEVRIARARYLLAETEDSIREVSANCGFADQGYFTKVFSAEAGFSPTEFRARLKMNQEDADSE